MTSERIDVQVRERTRLDVFLTRRLAHVSRSRVQKHIVAGDVLVDGRAVRPNTVLCGGEVILLTPFAARREALAAHPVAFDIVYEDDDLVVVDKPAGLVVHPVGREYRHTLLNGLHHRLRERGADTSELGIVHRLDRLTTGLVVVAKTLAARRTLSDAIEHRRVSRKYVGLVVGAPPAESGTIEYAIRRDPARPTRMQALDDAETAAAERDIVRSHVSASGYSDPHLDARPRAARTRWAVLRRLHGTTLLRFQLETGRTHQIRAHAQRAGWPLLGDPLYGPDPAQLDARLAAAHAALARPALHASRLDLRHPRSGEAMRFRATLPADLRAVLAR